tara:strand:- start:4736 stop:4885 length:150 start_codon:yes stop_codon:yes gene_type:complete
MFDQKDKTLAAMHSKIEELNDEADVLLRALEKVTAEKLELLEKIRGGGK